MEIKNLDISIPRRRYYRNALSLDCCPECGAKLIPQFSTIILVVKTPTDEAQFATSHNGSQFCEKCPVVMFNKDIIQLVVAKTELGKQSPQISIAGIINMDAIPKDKQHLELGSDENPIPLVKFLPNLPFKPLETEKRVGANELCICGSGKKFKKCCGKV